MIDEIGDLYYDSGDPDVGLYAVRGCTTIARTPASACIYALRGGGYHNWEVHLPC